MIGGKVGCPTPRLRHGNAKGFCELDYIGTPAGSPDLWSDMEDWILALKQHLRRPLDVFWIGRDVHRHRETFAREDFGFEVCLVKDIARHANKGGAAWRG